MSDFSGYPIDKEDRDYLRQLPSAVGNVPLFGEYEEQRLDPRELIKVENQGSVGSCQGHALSSCMEWCFAIATNGQKHQLSRAMGYYETQRLDGINGDRGSTISGGVKLARGTGLCSEPLWPYSGRYDPRRPSNWSDILSDASKYKIARAVQIKSYDEFRAFLGSMQGGIHIGIAWGNSMSRAVIESFSPGMGGHAISGLCLSERVDSQGRPYAWIMNSWGQSVGSREYPGWHEWSPNAISQMLRHQWTEMVGLSDMPDVKPRKLSLEDWKSKLRV